MTSPAPLNPAKTRLPDLFTTEEAYAAGLTKYDLSSGSYRRLFRGGYAKVAAVPSYNEQVAFALRAVPSAQFATQYSAARLLRGWTPLVSNLHLGTRVRRSCDLAGIRLHFYKNEPDLIVVEAIPTTSPGQTFLDLARSLEFVDLLVLGDSFARQRGCCSPEYLRSFVADSRAHGAPHAREVAALVRRNVRSPNETRLRLLIVSGGLPEPTINFTVRNRERTKKREIDLALEKWKVAIEFDGQYHLARDQWERDILRREELEGMGWRFVVITSTALYADPLGVLQRIVDKIVLAGGPRFEIHGGWRRHFG